MVGTARSPRPEFVALGLDHSTAGIGLRERMAFLGTEIPAVLRRLTKPAGLLDQAVILSTCNRVELYGIARARPDECELASFMADSRGLKSSQVVDALSVYRGDAVVHHLLATAAGMHSLVLGETQIMGQIRRALDYALAAGTAGPELRRLFESSIAAGRRVRAATAISRGVLSVPVAGVELARRRRGALSQSTVLLIGTGQAAWLAARQLVKRETKQLLVLGRDVTRAEEFALAHRGRAITFERLEDALTDADVVISATGSHQPVLGSGHLRRPLARRRAGCLPLLVIDLSVPRDVEPAAAALPGVEVHTVDDLRSAVDCALAQRRAALPLASALLEGEVARFTAWLNRRAAAG